jgi:peptide/nickel transport system ATP-binding protein
MSDGMNHPEMRTHSVAPLPLLEVRGLKKYFPIYKGGLIRKVVNQVRAVDDVSFFVRQGETLGLVGESGCGKTTVSRCILRAFAPTSGEILFREMDDQVTDLSSLDRRELRRFRPQMQMIFQDPFGSLNPRMTIFEIISEPLYVNGRVPARSERIGLPSSSSWSACGPNTCSATRMLLAAVSVSALA